jgi:hypothetical protein
MPEFAGITAEDPNSIFRALIAMTARTITEPEKKGVSTNYRANCTSNGEY